jgi:hypothetical protein
MNRSIGTLQLAGAAHVVVDTGASPLEEEEF